MKTYLVGGAVRDELLKRPVKERDYVVVGATREEMLALNYQQVGKDFPVFLHPLTKEEYALARIERKVSPGYTGFTFDATQSVILEEDLLRRDLTINAMAKDEAGNIIDPYGGLADIEGKWLRHVSRAFIEDPLRVLRVARFLARYYHLGFRVAEETKALMRELCRSGELDALVPERVWAETEKALGEKDASQYFECLREVGALAIVFPEVDALFGVPQTKKWHGEIDTGVHTMMVLKEAVALSDSSEVRFAALCHDLGKALTPVTVWPSHHGHDAKGVKPITRLCERCGVPSRYKKLATKVAKYHTLLHKVKELSPRRLVQLFDELDAYRNTQGFQDFITACKADAFGRIGSDGSYSQADYIQEAYRIVSGVKYSPQLVGAEASGEMIKKALNKERTERINAWRKDNS